VGDIFHIKLGHLGHNNTSLEEEHWPPHLQLVAGLVHEVIYSLTAAMLWDITLFNIIEQLGDTKMINPFNYNEVLYQYYLFN
jgi:hypothetical protein